jgi:uncharacterized membrane protein YuzA (DUF378 family)
MTKKEIAFMISMNIITILLNIVWMLTDMETYMFLGICAVLPTIVFLKMTKEAINESKADKEI